MNLAIYKGIVKGLFQFLLLFPAKKRTLIITVDIAKV